MACIYSFNNIYYKYIIFRFSIPPSIKTTPLVIYPGNFQSTLLLRSPVYLALKINTDSNTDAASWDWKMLITAALLDFSVQRSPSIFDNKLLILRWIKFKPLLLKNFHSLENCVVFCWTGPGFKVILPESNNSNWENEFRFSYSSFETE